MPRRIAAVNQANGWYTKYEIAYSCTSHQISLRDVQNKKKNSLFPNCCGFIFFQDSAIWYVKPSLWSSHEISWLALPFSSRLSSFLLLEVCAGITGTKVELGVVDIMSMGRKEADELDVYIVESPVEPCQYHCCPGDSTITWWWYGWYPHPLLPWIP